MKIYQVGYASGMPAYRESIEAPTLSVAGT